MRRQILFGAAVLVLAAIAAGSVVVVRISGRPVPALARAEVAPDRSTTVTAGSFTVTIPAGAVESTGQVRLQPGTGTALPDGMRTGPLVEVVLEGTRLSGTATVTARVPDESGAATGGTVWLAHRHGGDGWQAEPVTVNPTTRLATAQVDRFSLFGIAWLDPDAIGKAAGGALDWLVYGDPGGAPQPVCAGTTAGVSVEVTGDLVHWCQGSEGSELVLRVVNAAAFPILVRHPQRVALRSRSGVRGVTPSVFVEALSAASQQRSGERAAVLRPGEQATFAVDAATPGAAVLSVSSDPMSLLGSILDTAVEMYVAVTVAAAKLGLVRLPGGITPSELALGWDLLTCQSKLVEALARPDLANALADIASDLVGCIADAAEEAIASAVVSLLAKVVGVVVGIPAALLRDSIGLVRGLVAELSGRSTTRLTVTVDGQPVPLQVRPLQPGGSRNMLLMDVSGSMADDDGAGTVKIEGAKAAVTTVLDGMRGGALVGLRTYPSGGADCGSGSLRYGLTAPTDPALRAEVAALATGGGTPTGPALRAAADDLHRAGLTDGSTIVLVSDGESNCGDNPCEVAREIAGQGLAVVHTVGFRISAQGATELQCIASATGGRYFDAADSASLQRAVDAAATPRLTVSLNSPATETVSDGALVTISATVANTSQLRVDDVQVLLRFPATAVGATPNHDPGVIGPIRTIGNLAAGEQRSIEWQYRASIVGGVRQAHFTVAAAAANASPAEVAGTVRYSTALRAAAGPLLRDATRVAIVGDSFSSGEGAGDYLPGTDEWIGNLCHRSRHTYATSLDWPNPPTVLACSGAVTADVRGLTDQYDEPSQVQQLRRLRDRPDLVLMTIGGNDVQFTEVITHCFLTTSCQATTRYPNPQLSASCQQAYLRSGAYRVAATYLGRPVQDALATIPRPRGCGDEEFVIPFRTAALAQIATIGDDLLATYVAVDAAVNGNHGGSASPIVVLAYPKLVPYHAENRGHCSDGLDNAELIFGDQFTEALNQKIAETVERARASGLPITFAAEVSDALRPNHTLCDREPHANRLSIGQVLLGKATPLHIDREVMHPNADGYRDMTAALVRWSLRPDATVPDRQVADAPELPVHVARTPGVIQLDVAPSATWPDPLQAGSNVMLQGDGFAPGAPVSFTVQSAPRSAGTTVADDRGRISAPALLPADLARGEHALIASGIDPDGSPRLLVAVVTVHRPQPFWRLALWTLSALFTAGGGLALALPLLHRRRETNK